MNCKLTVLLLLISTFTIIGCLNKSPVGPTEESELSDPPIPPNLELSQPVIDFFAGQSPDNNPEDTSAYELASELVLTDFNPFVQSIYAYLPFLDGATNTEPEPADEGWEWKYSYTSQDQSYSIRLASSQPDEDFNYTLWTLYITTSQSELGELNNYKLMELSSNSEEEDSDRGFWQIYPPEYRGLSTTPGDTPYLGLEWDIYGSNEEYSYNFDPFSPNSNEATQAYYSSFDNEEISDLDKTIQMYIENAEFEVKTFTIAWNSNTNEGLLNLEGNPGGTDLFIRRCWDENLNDTECQF